MNEKDVEVKIDAESLRILKRAAWLWSMEGQETPEDTNQLKRVCRKAQDILIDSGAKI